MLHPNIGWRSAITTIGRTSCSPQILDRDICKSSPDCWHPNGAIWCINAGRSEKRVRHEHLQDTRWSI